jgi:hypothetical protein
VARERSSPQDRSRGNRTPMNRKATPAAISRAVEAARAGEATRLDACSWMTLTTAQARVFDLLERGDTAKRVTAYIEDGMLYIGPRKKSI